MTAKVQNVEPIPLQNIPLLTMEEWRKKIIRSVGEGEKAERCAALFGVEKKGASPSSARLFAVLASEDSGRLTPLCTEVEKSFPSLTPECPQAHRFEREIFEALGIEPLGHPFLKPIRSPITSTDFYSVEGDEIHEVAVGPVHAGIIEPGHFRFQCHGERVYHLEIALGYQHRGVERSLCGGPDAKALHLLEVAAGDTTAGHSLAFCQAMEGLLGLQVPSRAVSLRRIALELERLANHVGDMGALSMDVGFLPTASFCGRIRGDFLNLTAELCGSRLGRGLLRVGGVGFEFSKEAIPLFLKKLKSAYEDTLQAIDLLWETPSVLSRFEQVGKITKKQVQQLGCVGLVARSTGIKQDVRFFFPLRSEERIRLEVASQSGGDVLARARVREQEIRESFALIEDELTRLEGGPAEKEALPLLFPHSFPALPPDHLVVSLTEGWRGEICHVVITDHGGKFLKYKIVDPSFHNWNALELALRNQEISDFPLCNKSFNLSYCGHDL